MIADGGDTIQAMVLGSGNAVSPYTVLADDKLVEFTEDGDATCALETGGSTTTSVMAGSRYAIGPGVKTITFGGKFSVC